jgi:hypothetical protein
MLAITNPQHSVTRTLASKELALLAGFLFVGLTVLPYTIYGVGQSIFGAYAGIGYGDFFGTLSGKVRAGDIVALFLVLSPYFGWQCLRLAAFAWRAAGRT